ncbi:MAG: mechanosensitive ion channel family protein [Planctomycetota bacterium]
MRALYGVMSHDTWGRVTVSLLLLAGLFIGALLVRRFWRRILHPFTTRTKTNLDRLLVEYTERPVFFLMLVGGMNLIFAHLRRGPPFENLFISDLVAEGLYILAVLAITTLVYAMVRTLCDWYVMDIATKTKTNLDDQLLPVLRRVAMVAIYFIAVTVVLGHYNVQITALLGAAGIVSLAVALASQDTISNMISGFTILVDRPFRVGDRIEMADGRMGDVFEVGLRSTKILSFDNTLLIIPNSEISKTSVANHSYPDSRVKIRQTIGVAYGSDVKRVKAVIGGVLGDHPDILRDPPPSVFFTEFAESSLNLLVVFWIADYRDRMRILDAVNMAIKERFEKEGIEIPFPQRDIHIRSGGVFPAGAVGKPEGGAEDESVRPQCPVAGAPSRERRLS